MIESEGEYLGAFDLQDHGLVGRDPDVGLGGERNERNERTKGRVPFRKSYSQARSAAADATQHKAASGERSKR